MKIKIKSKTQSDKFIYGDLLKKKGATNLVVFTSGLSGSKALPLFKKAVTYFTKRGFSTLKFNFCDDNEDEFKKADALKIWDMSSQIYLKELKNIVDNISNKYPKVVFIGHSFGAVVSILFLAKYKNYKKSKLVLWDPSLLPWDKELMSDDFTFDTKKKLYTDKLSGDKINQVFYKELVTTDTIKILGSLNNKICIIAAKNSADMDSKKYFSVIRNKKLSRLIILTNTNHYFDNEKSQKKLFRETIKFII